MPVTGGQVGAFGQMPLHDFRVEQFFEPVKVLGIVEDDARNGGAIGAISPITSGPKRSTARGEPADRSGADDARSRHSTGSLLRGARTLRAPRFCRRRFRR